MSIYKTVYHSMRQLRSSPPPMLINGRKYVRQAGTAHLTTAEDTAARWRKEGLFVRIIRSQALGHPKGKPKLTYSPTYELYISPKRTKKLPDWFVRIHGRAFINVKR